MALPNWLTLSALAAQLNMTEAELLEKYPNAEKDRKQALIDLKAWIFPNCAQGREACLAAAALMQWEYMQSDEYRVAWSLVSGIAGFRIGDFSVLEGNGITARNPIPSLMGYGTRQILLNCGLLCRATACGVARC